MYAETAIQVQHDPSTHGETSYFGAADEIERKIEEKLAEAVCLVQLNTCAETSYIGKRINEKQVEIVASSDHRLIGYVITNDVNDEGLSAALPFSVFEQKEELADEEVDDEKSIVEKPLPNFVHVKNMLRDPCVPFLNRIPMLGSFVAVQIPFTKYVHTDAIPADGGLIIPDEKSEYNEETSEKATEEEKTTEEEKATEEEKEAEAEGYEVKPEEVSVPTWNANTIESSYVLCIDTMGASQFTSTGVSDSEIEFLRRFSNNLSISLSESQNNQYQAEMQQRERLSNITELSKVSLAADLERIQEISKIAIDEYEAALASESDVEVPEEERALKLANINLNAARQVFHRDTRWWLEHFKAERKLCIPPKDSVLSTLQIILQTYEMKQCKSWTDIKSLDVDSLVNAVAELGPDNVGGLEAQSSLSKLHSIEELESDSEDSQWLVALITLAKASLVAIIKKFEFEEYVAQVKAKQEAEAEAEAKEQEEKQQVEDSEEHQEEEETN